MQRGQRAFEHDQTAGAVLAWMTRAFAEAGLDSAARDARILLQGLLGIDGTALLTKPEQPIGSATDLIADAVRRRLAHEPVSRILGARSFYGREFIVTPDVLDPRPDTETVVELALEIIKSARLDDKALRIADIGTGSGILIVTLLAELPLASGVATDVSPAALEVAQRNAERLGVASRASFVATRGLDGCDEAFRSDRFEPTLHSKRRDSWFGPRGSRLRSDAGARWRTGWAGRLPRHSETSCG